MDYQFGAPGKVCAVSGKPLSPGDRCVSALVEQGGKLVRLDFLEAHWTGEPPHSVGSWKYQIPMMTPQQQRQMSLDSLLRFFEQLAEEANPSQQRVLYVVALSLLQNRKLKLEGTRRDGPREFLIFLGPKGEGPFEVLDQQLTSDELTALQQELQNQLLPQWEQAA